MTVARVVVLLGLGVLVTCAVAVCLPRIADRKVESVTRWRTMMGRHWRLLVLPWLAVPLVGWAIVRLFLSTTGARRECLRRPAGTDRGNRGAALRAGRGRRGPGDGDGGGAARRPTWCHRPACRVRVRAGRLAVGAAFIGASLAASVVMTVEWALELTSSTTVLAPVPYRFITYAALILVGAP